MEEIIVRSLTLQDITDDLLNGFIRLEQTSRIWEWQGNQKVVVAVPWGPFDWTGQDYQNLLVSLRSTLKEGGAVFAAFTADQKIAGIASVTGTLAGKRKEYVELLKLHISAPYRGKKIGTTLFKKAVCAARTFGAVKMYISAHPGVRQQAFYERLGCVDAVEIIHLDDESDIPLELVL